MKEILQKISLKKQALGKEPFIEWLKNKDITIKEKYSFVPAMAFFIMGFKDILLHLKATSPETEIGKLVITHCDEDLGHWEWYIKDLEKLGFDFSAWGEDLTSFFSRFWGNDTRECRHLVYLIMHYAQSTSDPRVLLVMIEVMEATFGVFIGALHRSSINTGIDEKLEFFGLKHRVAESNHSLGNWVGEGDVSGELDKIVLLPELRQLSSHIVDDLFNQFGSMFDEWFLLSNSYQQNIKERYAVYS